MSALLARVMLTIFMLPCAAFVYIVAFVTIDRFLRANSVYIPRDPAWLAAGIATWAFVAGYWLLLWRRTVAWTSQRLGRTLGATGIAALVGGIAGVLGEGLDNGFGFFLGPSIAILIWLVLTTLAWRETSAERAARAGDAAGGLACPTCGYNLTGVKGTRCPECGTEFTVDQLIAARRESAGVELQ